MSATGKPASDEGEKIITTCQVFGCHRWTGRLPPGSEYLCPDHWKAVPAAHRRAYSRARRKEGDVPRPDGTRPLVSERGENRLWRLWRACVRQAMMRTGGLR